MSALSYLFCAAPAMESVEESKPLSFSMGRVLTEHLTRRERIAKAKQKKAKKVKAVRKVVRHNYYSRQERYIPPFRGIGGSALEFVRTYSFDFTKPPKSWLLTQRGVPYPAIKFLEEAGKTFTEIYLEIIKNKRRQQRYFANCKCYTPGSPSLPLLKIYMEAAMKNQRLRTIFGRLARRWIQKRLRLKNTEDLMTGEKPVELVTIVDWSNRSIYEFEAKTIYRDMVSRLMVTTWMFFPAPKSPRNPYTNEALTEGQFYSVMKQLRRHGHTHWALEALHSSKYNLKEFDRDLYVKLKRTHHNTVFSNPASEAAKEVLLDFIEDEHKSHAMDYEQDIYVWATENHSYHHKMHEWRIQCEKHYRIQHFPGEKEKDDDEKDRISDATKRLCAYPMILVEKYNAAHEKKYVKVEDRRVAVAHAHVMNIHYVVEIPDVNLAAIIAAYAEDDTDTASTHTNDTADEAD